MVHSTVVDATTQPQRALALLERQGCVRLGDFLRYGITAATIRRLEQKGKVVRLARGLYRLIALDPRHALAEASKLVPEGTVCLDSALAFHALSDTVPSRVWMAIGRKTARPGLDDSPLWIVRFGPRVLDTGVEVHTIEGIEVRIYDPAKTIVDVFRYRQSAAKRSRFGPGPDFAIEGLRNGLQTGKAMPAKIARYAEEAGVWKVVAPYLDAMTGRAAAGHALP